MLRPVGVPAEQADRLGDPGQACRNDNAEHEQRELHQPSDEPA